MTLLSTCFLLAAPQLGCGLGLDEPTASEVGVSAVSGAVSGNGASAVAMEVPAVPRQGTVELILDALNPIGTAWAATWTCSGGTLTPTPFAGPASNPYSWTPVTCTITWDNNKTASSTWSGPFTLNYGSSCDAVHPRLEDQTAGCSLTRTTKAGGVTRTIVGPNGTSYAIDHDTNGAGTGWDSSVSPAPSNGGVVATCDSTGCTAGRTIVFNGSHLMGTVTPEGGAPKKVWDHTVSSGASPITVTGSGSSRVVSGEVIVQHNLAKYTATVQFNDVGYGEVGCCFPTSGSVSTSFSGGASSGKTESLAFSNVCGQATLTNTSGATSTITLKHCL